MMFIQESWLKKCDQVILTRIREQGFKVHSEARRLRGGGGLCVIFKEHVQLKENKYRLIQRTFEVHEGIYSQRG